MIKFYKTIEPYGYLNNFFYSEFEVFGKKWWTVEHAYQSQKTNISEEAQKIIDASTPRIARNIGQTVTLIDNWDNIKNDIMEQCVYAKFSQNEVIKKRLISTKDEEIIEDSKVDYWFGIGEDGTGQNHLGKILMKVRERLQKEKNNE